MSGTPRRGFTLFACPSWAEAPRIVDILRRETIGGALLLGAALVAMVWANSPWAHVYEAVRGFRLGPAVLHLNLPLAGWAADGLLAVFFFVAGLELKRELVAGDLRSPRRAAVPVAAAVAGVLVPAGLYLLVVFLAGDGAVRGWAVPAATDIAFALAVLAVVGRHLPAALRTFLLTLAVVDDLLAIVIIAVFYTTHLAVLPLLAGLLVVVVFAVVVRGGVRAGWVLLPLAAATWVLVHASGVHATVAGVALAFVVPARRGGGGDRGSLAERWEHRWRPVSAGLAVPVFALLAAGVAVGGLAGLARALTDPVTVGIVVGLVVGKTVGVLGGTWMVARFTRAHLDEGVGWFDVLGLAVLAGIGFTVSLLITDLAFGSDTAQADHAKTAVLAGSLTAALLASILLRVRDRTYRRWNTVEDIDRREPVQTGG